MTKQALRNKYKLQRTAFTDSEKEKMQDLILIQFQKLQLPFLQYVHTYLAMEERSEIPTDAILSYLQFRNPGLTILIPLITPNRESMVNVVWDETTRLKRNHLGFTEPVNGTPSNPQLNDLILVPLLAYDLKGNRVGYGKGYYDRFLAECRPDALKIGFSYFEPEEQINDTEDFDIPLNYCVTPHRCYEFG